MALTQGRMVQTTCFQWIIDDCFLKTLLTVNKHETLRSEFFPNDKNSSIHFEFGIENHLNCDYCTKSIRFFIRLLENEATIWSCTDFSVLHWSANKWYYMTINKPFGGESIIVTNEFQCFAFLTDGCFKREFLPTSSALSCKIELSCKDGIKDYSLLKPNIMELNQVRKDKLASHQKLLITGLMADCTLKVEDRDISAHKCMLANNSDVFSAMFENPMKEKEDGIIVIEDSKYESVRAMVEFMYCGDLAPSLKEHEEDVLVLANKYAVTDLKEYCATELVKSISLNNVVHLANFAKMHRSDSLFEGCCRFFVLHRSEIICQPEWTSLKELNKEAAFALLEF